MVSVALVEVALRLMNSQDLIGHLVLLAQKSRPQEPALMRRMSIIGEFQEQTYIR